MTTSSKLALGTVQFGLDYGVSNPLGKTPQAEVSQILTYAFERGIQVLDSSCNYGDAEQAIGNYQQYPFNIITKTPVFGHTAITSADQAKIVAQFQQSQALMPSHQVQSLLLHHGENLLNKNGEWLYQTLLELKQQGLVKHIGVSIYNAQQLRQIIEHFDIDIVQLPFNVLDQQLLHNGVFQQLHKQDIQIHVRSVFLQGLLLMPLAQLPSYFSPIKPLLMRLANYLEQHNTSALTLAYRFVEQIPEITNIICGVNSLAQLKQLTELPQLAIKYNELEQFSIDDPAFTCPVNWR